MSQVSNSSQSTRSSVWKIAVLTLCTLATLSSDVANAALEDAAWIWVPSRREASRTAYFRKTFQASAGSQASIEITCDETYELYINGVKVATDDHWQSIDTHSLSPYLVSGKNAVTIATSKSKSGPAGLAASITLTAANGQQRQLPTNSSWRAHLRRQTGWQREDFNDSRWPRARQLGRFGNTAPWNDIAQVVARVEEQQQQARFQVDREFRVEWIVRPDDTGSVLAFAFNEFGNIIASQEKGPLLLIRDTTNDGVHDTVSTYCDKVTNCQGILPLNGEVFATGDGPDGLALYRLKDTDRDGVADDVKPIIKFKGKAVEHGPHAITLGPDGLIYVVVGNHTNLVDEPRESSPYRDFYEGDLVQPRLEDPEGYARGRPAPGGMILRTDTNGSFVERFAGGLRNPYDIVFNAAGDLFSADSDMEWDDGLPWYRPTWLSHVTAGSEHGWRSGWAKWPSYYVDSVPPVLTTGPGSPTGMAVYEHHMFPVRYHNTIFVGDWARGQIRALKYSGKGATYAATSHVFVEGSPLNVTDLEVAPNGALYFSTGGRGTEGGIYRVVWLGRVPKEIQDRGEGIEAALKQPQPSSAWGRQEVARAKKQAGDSWGEELIAAAKDSSRTGKVRARALQLMQLFGPFPSEPLLLDLSRDRSTEVRATVAFLLGLHKGEMTNSRLVDLLSDPNERVVRLACESLSRTSGEAPIDKLLPLLSSRDPFVAQAAASALKQIPRDQWQDDVIAAKELRTFLVGSTAILSQQPEKDISAAILERSREIMGGFVGDDDFIDLLRICQLAISRGEFTGDDLPELTAQLSTEFPAGNAHMNRELIRLLAHLQAAEPKDRYIEFLKSPVELEDKIHLGLHSPAFVESWNTEQRFEVLAFFEKSREELGSASYSRYLDQVARGFVEKMSDEERARVLEEGQRWPGAALGAIARLPKKLSAETRDHLIQLDGALRDADSPSAKRLRTGLVAVLARDGAADSMQYLRKQFEAEPNRRGLIAVGLAQDPQGENWQLLVRSLSVVEGNFAVEVLRRLAQADQRPDDPSALRQVILQGLKQQNEAGRRRAITLIEHWTEQQVGDREAKGEDILASWQTWYRDNYPLEPDPSLPEVDEEARYTFADLYRVVSDDDGLQGNAEHGKLVFTKAKCASCHRFGNSGEEFGPDLTTVSRRFHTKEILESIVYPSHVISDRYATESVFTTDGKTYTGIVRSNADGDLTVLQSDGNKITILNKDVDETAPNKTSTMPAGLLDELTKQEIADLFAFFSEAPTQAITRRRSESNRRDR